MITKTVKQYEKLLIEALGDGAYNVTGTETKDSLYFEVSVGYEQNFNFATLCKVAKVFGTLDFDVNKRKEDWAYSSWTSGTDYFTDFSVKKAKLGEGLPWDKESTSTT